MNNLSMPDLLKSKRFWSFAIMTVLIMLNEMTSLDLSDAQMDDIVKTAWLVIGGYILQDTAKAARTGITKYDRSADNIQAINLKKAG